MIEADAPSTEEVVSVSCARPTGGSHVLTTHDLAQRFKGGKRRARRCKGRKNNAANNTSTIKAGAQRS
jgi:hypothetical protein